MTTSTPWGKADNKEKVTKDSTFYTTPSHGGFRISKRLAQKIPFHVLQDWAIVTPYSVKLWEVISGEKSGSIWLEEDCARYVAEAYDIGFGITKNLEALESLKRNCLRFNKSIPN